MKCNWCYTDKPMRKLDFERRWKSKDVLEEYECEYCGQFIQITKEETIYHKNGSMMCQVCNDEPSLVIFDKADSDKKLLTCVKCAERLNPNFREDFKKNRR